jgi:hypothetical protein
MAVRPRKIHPLLTDIVRTALRTCDGVKFHTGPVCEHCGGHMSGYDEREKRFAILLEDDLPRPLHVIIQRSYCLSCGRIALPREPFYPGTRIGSPVVDLCRSLSRTMPYSRVSTYLGRMGVQVNRWSAREYSRTPMPEVPYMEVFGLRIPTSILALSVLPRPGSEPVNPTMDDVLRACNYPSVPASAATPVYGVPDASVNRERQQEYIQELLTRFPQVPGIVFITFSLLANALSGTFIFLPDGFLDLIGSEMEVLSV